MKLYSIMPLFTDHVKEICDDIERQYRDGIATEVLFKMTLTPEGNPAVNKARLLCEKFDLFKKELDKRGLRAGILVQATIGHGYSVGIRPPFQSIVALDGTPSFTICPYDEGFREYIKAAFAEIASHSPTSIMVDDDFRLFARSNSACVCPLHMKEISRRYGKEMTREELYEKLEESDEESQQLARIYYETNIDSLIGCAKAMREGIDSVDPTIQGTFCNCGDTCEGASEIAKILAGKGNPVIVRVNNGNYTPAGARNITGKVARCATQIAGMKDSVDVFLAETDTCPQNRYSTGAHSLHSHFVASILEGASGCKHWITRLAAYEPKSGEAYRKILAKYAGFYNELSRIVPSLDWVGCRIPLTKGLWEPKAPISKFIQASKINGWAGCVLERLGLPMYYSKKDGGTVFLDGRRDEFFSDEEIEKMLSGELFLAVESAKNLIKRGFGEHLGVEIEEIPEDDKRASQEIILDNGNPSSKQVGLHKLIPNREGVISRSMVVATPNGTESQPKLPLFPGVTSYKNELGGNVTVFSGTPEAKFHYTTAFSFLNESRKLQLINILSESGCLPVYYPDDSEVYMKAANMPDGALLVAFFNISLDPIEEITLVADREVKRIDALCPDGSYKQVSFRADGNNLALDISAEILTPVILIMR